MSQRSVTWAFRNYYIKCRFETEPVMYTSMNRIKHFKENHFPVECFNLLGQEIAIFQAHCNLRIKPEASVHCILHLAHEIYLKILLLRTVLEAFCQSLGLVPLSCTQSEFPPNQLQYRDLQCAILSFVKNITEEVTKHGRICSYI